MAIQAYQVKSGRRYRVNLMRNGKRISKVFTSRKDAEKFNAQLIVNDDLSDLLTSHVTATLTLNEACKDYLAQHQGRDTSIGQRLGWWCERFGDRPTGKVTKANVRTALKDLQQSKANATVNRYKAALSAVYAYLADEYDCAHNPAREVKQLKENNGRTRFLSDDEIARLLKSSNDAHWGRLRLLIFMAITTGARRTELLELRWSDIDFSMRRARVERTKNNEPRVLPLTEDLIQELLMFREVGNGYVFPHPNGRGDYFRNFDKQWMLAMKRAGIKDCRFHDLRHTAASLLAKSGASLLEIAEVLGHKSIQMTQRYAHLCVSHKANLIDNVMGNITSDTRRTTRQD